MEERQFKQLASDSLSRAYPAQVAALGPSMIADIVDGAYRGESIDDLDRMAGGRPNEIIEIVKLIFGAATFIKASIDIYTVYRGRNNRKPSPEEFGSELKKRGFGEVAPEQQRLLDEISKSG